MERGGSEKRYPRILNIAPEDVDQTTQRSLDNHACPRCGWSFTSRVPRALDCGHSFFFCENCLRKRDNVKCTMCQQVTRIQQSNLLSPQRDVPGRGYTPQSPVQNRNKTVKFHQSGKSDNYVSTPPRYPTLPTLLSGSSQNTEEKPKAYIPTSVKSENVNTTNHDQFAASRLKQQKFNSQVLVTNSNSELEAVRNEISRMSMNLTPAGKSHKDCDYLKDLSVKDQILIISKKLCDMREENEKYKSDNEHLKYQIQTLMEEFDNQRNAAKQDSSSEGLKSELEDMKMRMHQLRSKNELMEEIHRELTMERNEERDKVAKLQQKIELLQAEHRQVDMEAFRQELHSYQDRIEEVQHEYRSLEQRYYNQRDEHELEKSTLENAVHRLTSELQRMQSFTFRKLQNDCAVLCGDMRELRQDVDTELNLMLQQIGSAFSQIVDFTKQHNKEARLAIANYSREVKLRRKYFNKVQELKGNIRVFCRVRPLLDGERARGDTSSVACRDEYTLQTISEEKKREKEFEFDRIFHPNCTQEEVFVDTKPLITSVLDGYNVCIFAYGQTGSGKTYTMEGPSHSRGVNYRAISELFQIIRERQDTYEYEVKLSMLEIYNENIRDLLKTRRDSHHTHDFNSNKKSNSDYLRLRLTKDSNVFVQDLSERECTSLEDVLAALDFGAKNRSVGVTNMNEHSSRSHSILSLQVSGRNIISNQDFYGKLHLIDLAGSERTQKSKATGDRMQEAKNINRSLSSLGKVISSIRKKESHIPYRDSKLTFFLQDSLGGQSKVLMFVNISPSIENLNETFCSLLFAQRVRDTSLGYASKNVVRRSSSSQAGSASSSSSRLNPRGITASQSHLGKRPQRSKSRKNSTGEGSHETSPDMQSDRGTRRYRRSESSQTLSEKVSSSFNGRHNFWS